MTEPTADANPPVAMPIGQRNNASVSLAGPIADDVACIGCDYNLRGLDAAGVCPECALPIADSLAEDETPLNFDDYRRPFAIGLALLAATAAFILLMELFLLYLVEGLNELVIGSLWLIGALYVSRRLDDQPQTHRYLRHRPRVRRSLLASAIAIVVLIGIFQTGVTLLAIGGVLVTATIVAIHLWLTYRHLAAVAETLGNWRRWLLVTGVLVAVGYWVFSAAPVIAFSMDAIMYSIGLPESLWFFHLVSLVARLAVAFA